MYTREETIELLRYFKKASEENTLPTPDSERPNYYRSLLKIVDEAESAEMAYIELGRIHSSTVYEDFDIEEHYIPFENIYYREDCYEYLLTQGFSHEDASELTEVIRRGAYFLEHEQIFKDRLSKEFITWAINTGYLYSRTCIFNDLYREYEKLKFENKYSMPQIGRVLTDVDKKFKEDLLSRPETLYTHDIIKGKSSIYDDNNNQAVVTDYIAKKLLQSDLLDSIKPVKMPINKTYLIESHDGEPTTKNSISNRIEERIAMDLYNKYTYCPYRLFVADYQVPICRDSSVKEDDTKHIGKIDLVAADPELREVYLMELKKPDNKESLLRCVTEIYTYFKQIDKVRLTREIGEKYEFRSTGLYKVLPAVLVFEGSEQHLQLRSKLFNNVQKLMLKLGVRFFVIRPVNKYSNTDLTSDNYGRLKITETPVDIIK